MKKLVFAAVMALSFAAMAEGPMPPPPHYGPRPAQMGEAPADPLVFMVMNPHFAEKLGLSEEQKAKLGELKGNRASSRELGAKVGTGMKKQMELLKAEPIDEAAVMAAIDEVFEARKVIAKEQTKRLITILSILTPEQIKMAREELKKGPRGPHMGPDMGPGMGHRRGPGAEHGEKGHHRGPGHRPHGHEARN